MANGEIAVAVYWVERRVTSFLGRPCEGRGIASRCGGFLAPSLKLWRKRPDASSHSTP